MLTFVRCRCCYRSYLDHFLIILLQVLLSSWRSANLVPRVLSYPPYGARERAGRREPWEQGWLSARKVRLCLLRDLVIHLQNYRIQQKLHEMHNICLWLERIRSSHKEFTACTVTQWKIKMQTIQYRRTRIWEMKKDKYTKTLAKNQVCEIFQMRDIGKNGLPKFIKLCMETPCWCPFQEHQYGRRIPTETSVFEFSY